MATIEINGKWKFKDKEGNLYLIYPITKSENVQGSGESTVCTTVSLLTTGWEKDEETRLYTKTVTVSGVSATETAQMIHVVPAAASQTAYLEAGVYASAQSADAITFTAASIPESTLTVYVVIESI